MNSIREKILEQIEAGREATIDFLKKLLAFPSVTGNEKEIQAFISEELRKMGLKVEVWEPDLEELKKHPGYVPVTAGYKDRPNVVGVYKGSGAEGGRSLLFNGHVDVIPAEPLSAWEHSPWGDVEGERVYGRGSSDMKSGLASMTMAVKAVIDSGVNLKGDVTSEYVVDEELSGNGTLACILRGYRADGGISCETSSLKVQPACIGRIWFEIEIHGKPAGIQRRWEGVNAIEKGYKVMQAVAALEKKRISELSHPLYPDSREALPCMVGLFQAGSFPSAFPDTCVLKGSLATLPGEDSEAIKQAFRQHILDCARGDEWLNDHPPEIRFKGYFAEPSEISVKAPIVEAVKKNVTEVTGAEPVISGRMGAADTRFLNQYGDTPTVIFGPGLTEQMHAMNEWVKADDVITATKILALTILDWCGYESVD